jgi:hypothetical protein
MKIPKLLAALVLTQLASHAAGVSDLDLGVSVALAAPTQGDVPLPHASPKTAAPLATRTISTPPLSFNGSFAGTRTIGVAALTFEGDPNPQKSIAVVPPPPSQVVPSLARPTKVTKTVAVQPLSFAGTFAGDRTLTTPPLSFVGVAALPPGDKTNAPLTPPTKGVAR